MTNNVLETEWVVNSIVNKYLARDLHLEKDDLYQAGRLALVIADQKYDALKGVKFSTYAYKNVNWAIKKEIDFQLQSSNWDLLEEVEENSISDNNAVLDEQILNDDMVVNILDCLDDNEYQVLKLFYGAVEDRRMNYREIGVKLDLSEYEVEEIKENAIKKLKIKEIR